MGLDIRVPIGSMFSLLGLILLVFGLATHGQPMYQHSLGINVNVWWGGALLAFGLVMWHFGRRAMKRHASRTTESA